MTVCAEQDLGIKACADVHPAEAAFLQRLQCIFDRLRAGNVPFCILRNRDRIPKSLLTGSDVDVIVPTRTSIRKLIALIADLQPAHVVPHHATLEVYFSAAGLFMHVDFLIADRQWRGATYLKNTDILANVRDDAGMPVASTLHQAFCAWFSSLTRKRHYKERYSPLVARVVEESPAEMRGLLTQTFGGQLGRELLALAENNRIEESNSLAKRCRRTIWRRAFIRRPIRTICEFFSYYAAEVALYFKPTGLVVSILGPDGAGKSTVCSIVASSNRAILPFNTIETQHMYERALPRLSELKKGRIRRTPLTSAATHDPHGKRPHSRVVSMFTLLYTAIDQWISGLWFGRRKLAKNMLLLHDRQMLEIVVDPKRFRYSGPKWLSRLFIRAIPQPDLVILLDAPADVLHSRKQEVPIEETRRQRAAYRDLVSSMSGGRIINCDRPADEVAEHVKQLIAAEINKRSHHRFRTLRARKIEYAPAEVAPVQV